MNMFFKMRYDFVEKNTFATDHHRIFLFVYPGCQQTPEKEIDKMKKLIVNIFMDVYDPDIFYIIFFPELVISKIFGISGLFLTDLVHIVVGFMISMFLIVHVYFCLLGTNLLSSFKSMINGWAEVH